MKEKKGGRDRSSCAYNIVGTSQRYRNGCDRDVSLPFSKQWIHAAFVVYVGFGNLILCTNSRMDFLDLQVWRILLRTHGLKIKGKKRSHDLWSSLCLWAHLAPCIYVSFKHAHVNLYLCELGVPFKWPFLFSSLVFLPHLFLGFFQSCSFF